MMNGRPLGSLDNVAAAGFYVTSLNLNSNGLRQHIHRKNKAKEILLANENSFNSFEGAADDAHAFSAFEEWIGFNLAGPVNDSLYCFNLLVRNNCNLFSAIENHVDSRSCYDLQFAIEASANENIARKQRQRKHHSPVFPTTS